jgi:hypothetical protein
MLARIGLATLVLACALCQHTQAASLAGNAVSNESVVARYNTTADTSFEAVLDFINGIGPAQPGATKPAWDQAVQRATDLSGQQRAGQPETLRFCEPELRVCNVGVVWKGSNGHRMFLRQAEDMSGKPLEREVCAINSFGDVRVCVDWDTSRKYRDMKDTKGHWYKVADQ